MQNRRKFIESLSGLFCASVLPVSQRETEERIKPKTIKNADFRYCLNTSTIRGQSSGLLADIEIAGRAGYNGVELWLRDIQRYLDDGGSKAELREKIADSGLTFENVMDFSNWIVDDPHVRNNAIEDLKRKMELLSDLGCKRIAAPPSGATNGKILDLFEVAERYRTILKIGQDYGVTPLLEVWGASANLHALGQAAFVIIETKHPDACMLLDIYHLHRGGSGFTGLSHLTGEAVSMFHLNDYPASIERTDLKDTDRVYTGDGSAPFPFIINELKRINPEMVLSLELFNAEYWKMDALNAAKLGLRKMKQVAQESI